MHAGAVLLMAQNLEIQIRKARKAGLYVDVKFGTQSNYVEVCRPSYNTVDVLDPKRATRVIEEIF